MRIRKNARLGGSSTSSSSSSSSFLVCQLNRSPWDTLENFSLQGGGCDDLGLNANGGNYFMDSFLASDSLPRGESMELLFECSMKPQPSKRVREGGELAELQQDMNKRGFEFDERIPSPLPQPPTKKVDFPLPSLVPKRRRRPKKRVSVASVAGSNPYEFYYYSECGPNWGKKRRSERSFSFNITAVTAECQDITITRRSSFTTQMMIEDEEVYHSNNGKLKLKMRMKAKGNKENEVDIRDSLADRELDCINDEDKEGMCACERRALKARFPPVSHVLRNRGL